MTDSAPSLSKWRSRPIAGLTALALISSLCPPSLAQSSPLPNAPLPSNSLPQPAVPPSLQPIPAPRAQTEEAYLLGAGDRIRVDIFRVPQYSGETEVLVDGTLNLPLVGNVSVEGMNLQQASAALSTAYGRFLRRPIVTLTLLTRRPLQIGVAGEVNRPGSYAIPLNGSQYPTLTQLVQVAGGITRSADVRQAQIRRPRRGGADQVIPVDLWQLLTTGDLRYDVTLRDGDTIFIPETTVALNEAPLLASSSIAGDTNKPLNIAVVGEVFRPGPYTVTGGVARTAEAGATGGSSGGGAPTVTRAIQVAGGIKPQADIRKVQIRRATRNGSEQTFEVNLWSLLTTGDFRQDAILQEGDTILVPTAVGLTPAETSQLATASFSPNSIRVNVVGEVTRAGVVEVPPNTPLNQAILAAGGFNNRARRSNVDLVRLNSDGTVTRRSISINFANGVNDQNNPMLQNNDVIVVNRSGLASVGDTLGSILNPLGGIFSIFNLPFQFLRIFQ